jgi:hypothetical protein
MAKTIDDILSELADGDITLKDVIKIASEKTDISASLKNIVDKLGSWMSLVDYAKFLAKEDIGHSEKTVSKYLGEERKKKKAKTYKEKEEGDEEESDEEAAMTESESESDISGSESEGEGEFTLSREDIEKAKLLTERRKREEEEREAPERKHAPRPPVVKYTTKPVEGGEVPIPIPAYIPTDPNRYFNKCKSEYRSATWLNSNTRRVTSVYTDEPSFGTNAPAVTYKGKTWYIVNDSYFKLQCTRGVKKGFVQDGDMTFTTPEGVTVSMAILYGFSDGTYAMQTPDTFTLEAGYFLEKFATPEQKKDLLVSRPFILDGSHTTNLARKIGKSKLAIIPNAEEVELSIARDGNNTIRTYFNKIADLYVFLDENSVFAQRIKNNYYTGVDIVSLPVSERVDYPELEPYYKNLGKYELDEMGWDLYYMEYVGSKDIKRMKPEKPVRPVIENENKDGKKVFFYGSIFRIDYLKDKFQGQDYKVTDESSKTRILEDDTEFIKKIMNMNITVSEQPKIKKARILDIFDILKENLQMIRNGEVPKLQKSADVCDYCEKHVGENTEFKSVVMNDANQTEIVKYCSINCFNKSPEE